MKVTYITLDPLRYPRVKKIAHSLKKHQNIKFSVMIPKVRIIPRGGKVKRVIYAIVNYTMIVLQIFFTKSEIFWVANCPDILAIPLILRKKYYIFDYRSPWSLQVESEFSWKFLVRLTAALENLALKHAKVITLTTSKLITKVKSFKKPIFVIPNYPLKRFGSSFIPREKFRELCGCSEKDKVVLFVGKLTRVEGADLLPKIIEGTLKRRTDIVFWIVGDGPFYPSLKEFAERFPKNVKLFGWRPYEEIPSFIVAADVCIIPRHKSPYSDFYNEEGVHKLSEYMFFEKPIIACGIAKSKEYLLVDETKMIDSILNALNGVTFPSRRKTWEDYSEKKIYKMFNLIESNRI